MLGSFAVLRCCLGSLAAAALIFFADVAEAASYVTFEDPYCSARAEPFGINSADTVVGTCYHGTDPAWAFVRTTDGTITNFAIDMYDPTTAVAIDEKGNIIGTANGGSIYHGYIRDSAGGITKFDVPAATATLPSSINRHGEIAGSFTDSQGAFHGFVRSPDGQIAKFDVHGHQTRATSATSINDDGTIVGFTRDANDMYHGFLRTADGTLSAFNVPGFQMTLAASINSDGIIAGLCGNSQTLDDLIGFVRGADGQFETFTGHHGGAGITQMPINKHGDVVTSYIDPKTKIWRGMLRKSSGKITFFDLNGAGTYATAINARGDAAGSVGNDNGTSDGFIRLQ